MAPSSARAVAALVQGFLQSFPEDAAKLLDRLPAREIVRVLRGEPVASAVAVLDRLTPEVASRVVEELDEALAGQVLPALDPSRAAALLAGVAPDVRAGRLALLDPRVAQELQALMSYPAGSAGRLMDPRVPTFRPDATVNEVLARLRSVRQRRVDDIFLVDPEGRLVGTVALQDVAISQPGERLEHLVRSAPASIRAIAPREEVVEELALRRLSTLPVVDFEGRLLGAIRHDRLVMAAQEEASADIQTMVGASAEERALSSAWFAVRKRLPWLQINLATAFLAAAVVGIFEDTIARFTALAVLLPVVAGQSGNTGAQALAVTMRGLALREVRVRQWLRVALKECNVAFVNGCAVALTTSAGVYVWSGSPGLAMVIGISMVISMVAAGLSGAAVPMILNALGQDPAQSSSIILTTITDVVGFLSFLGIATLMAWAL